jgi:hypothetical protein
MNDLKPVIELSKKQMFLDIDAIKLAFFFSHQPELSVGGFVVFIGQAVAMIVQKPGGNLLPLGLILFAFFGAIGALPTEIGAGLRRWVEGFARRGRIA